MADDILAALQTAKAEGLRCALATVAATTGSVPRQAGSKMLVYDSGRISGTIGGGKFEALVIEDCLASIQANKPLLKTYPLHEAAPESFGAICGGEVTVLIEPQGRAQALFLIGGGHCAQAIAKLAVECGMHVTVVDDRENLLNDLPESVHAVADMSPAAFLSGRAWAAEEALVMVSRNYEIDRDALRAGLQTGAGYIGMIGSDRKVRRVFDSLRAEGVSDELLAMVYAPVGLDIGADSPAEIAVSVIAEILQVQRGRPGGHLRIRQAPLSGRLSPEQSI